MRYLGMLSLLYTLATDNDGAGFMTSAIKLGIVVPCYNEEDVLRDWASRRIPAFRLSDTLTADFCVEALEEAIAKGVRNVGPKSVYA